MADKEIENKNQGLAKQPNKITESPVGVYAYDLSIIEDLRARFNYDKKKKKKKMLKMFLI